MPIGFFDSGVGGLSVLREAIKLMPNEDYIYFGDSKNAPYGVRTTEEVKELTYRAVDKLFSKGAKAIVIACNTATSAAVAALRLDYPDVPIVGIEPAVKPAVKMKRSGPIIIMATPMTLKERKFYLKEKFNKYENKDIAAIVLGCTHYPFIADRIHEVIGGDVPVIDGGLGTCKELRRRLELHDLLTDSSKKGSVSIYNSLEGKKIIQLSKNLLGI